MCVYILVGLLVSFILSERKCDFLPTNKNKESKNGKKKKEILLLFFMDHFLFTDKQSIMGAMILTDGESKECR